MIEAVIWDMGGVICADAAQRSRARWEHQLGLLPGELARMVFYHPIAPSLFVGEARPEDMWAEIGEAFKLTRDEVTQLALDFWGEPEWNLDLLEYVRSLRGRYKLGLLSDAWINTRDTVREHINHDLFDVIMFSAEEGIRKPDPAIFLRMLDRLEIEADAAIFVDDREINTRGAEAVGMRAVLAKEGTHIPDAVNLIAG